MLHISKFEYLFLELLLCGHQLLRFLIKVTLHLI